MSRMKDYYEFLQLVYRLETDTLKLMLEHEDDEFKRSLLAGEIEARS